MRNIVGIVLFAFLWCGGCTPPEEGLGVACYESWECGDGYACEEGQCVALPDQEGGLKDRDLFFDSNSPIETDALPDASADEGVEMLPNDADDGRPDEFSDVLPDLVVDDAGDEDMPSPERDGVGGDADTTDKEMLDAESADVIPDADAVVPVDECVTQNNPCDDQGDSAAVCTDASDAYTCTCSEHYSWNFVTCVPETRTYTCPPKPATGTVWNTVDSYQQTWDGSGWYPPDSATIYNTTPSTTECRFKCAANYIWNGTACVGQCPSNLIIAQWTGTSDDGWVYSGHWRHLNNTMAWGNSTKNSSYDHSLAYNADIDLSACASGNLFFQIALADDAAWDSESTTDKNQRLYIECSGDGGASWESMIAPTLPAAQTKNNGCAAYYCDGKKDLDRSFSFTGQTWTTPTGCLTAAARFRFRANGSTPWDLKDPGWTVDTVIVND